MGVKMRIITSQMDQMASFKDNNYHNLYKYIGIEVPNFHDCLV